MSFAAKLFCSRKSAFLADDLQHFNQKRVKEIFGRKHVFSPKQLGSEGRGDIMTESWQTHAKTRQFARRRRVEFSIRKFYTDLYYLHFSISNFYTSIQPIVLLWNRSYNITTIFLRGVPMGPREAWAVQSQIAVPKADTFRLFIVIPFTGRHVSRGNVCQFAMKLPQLVFFFPSLSIFFSSLSFFFLGFFPLGFFFPSVFFFSFFFPSGFFPPGFFSPRFFSPSFFSSVFFPRWVFWYRWLVRLDYNF